MNELKFLLMCMVIFDLTITPQGVGAGMEGHLKQLSDIQGNYEYYDAEFQHYEEGIIGEAISEHVEEEPKESRIYMGTYELTAYAETGNCCADGVYPSKWFTAASNDPSLWHRWIYVEGLGEFYVHDTGGMSSNVIDIYLGDYDSCIQFGRQIGEVYVIEGR